MSKLRELNTFLDEYLLDEGDYIEIELNDDTSLEDFFATYWEVFIEHRLDDETGDPGSFFFYAGIHAMDLQDAVTAFEEDEPLGEEGGGIWIVDLCLELTKGIAEQKGLVELE